MDDEAKEKRKKLWFRAKKYGWGWMPVSWQGWLILAIYIFGVVYEFRLVNSFSHSVSDTLIGFFPRILGLTILFIWVCYKKGERPRWSWGTKK